jgi:hypothetical protein
MAKRVKTKISVDDQLAEHLKQAEEALIGAVKLFSERKKLSRRVGYYSRLIRAQEMITGLYQEELVRMRGTRRPRSRSKR